MTQRLQHLLRAPEMKLVTRTTIASNLWCVRTSKLRIEEILVSFRHDAEDYEEECCYHWDFDEAAILQAHLATGAVLIPSFTHVKGCDYTLSHPSAPLR